ncbi:MAG: alpha-amylase family glycosyl hydrolase [Elusimicrobiota bacterium]
MISPRSIAEIDLKPIPGKTYWSCEREWREEFIYFLMVDRFHDGKERKPASGPERSKGFGDLASLGRFCGGTLKGVTKNLGYIQDLGCTALWLSPIFENDPGPETYHGYAIRNYLGIDPRFGTKADLVELVDEAHRRGLRVFLDAVANHCGDVFSYPGDQARYYRDDHARHEFGGWRHPDYPVPVELRNPDYFHRRGQIRDWGWDNLPETQWGDFYTLKGFNNDDDPAGLELQETIIAAHRYWVREADIDGYRMDAVKHMGETAVARFCHGLREYAYSLGKRQFLLFGELVAGDAAINRYAGPNTAGKVGSKTVYYGLSSVLDFPLYWILPGVIKGFVSPASLISRHEALRERALSRGELGRYLITFRDNHDQIGQMYKRRFAAGAADDQVIAAVGYLLCALGTPCIYYGTEQGLAGEGNSDHLIRESLFSLDGTKTSLLNKDCRVYKAIGTIAGINRRRPSLRYGRMYFREVSGNGTDFGLPDSHPCTLAFSRLLAREETLVVYNTSTTERRKDCVVVDSALRKPGDKLEFLYGGRGSVVVESHPDPANGTRFVRLDLAPMQFAVLA